MMEYGYARASTREQNVERQLLALREFGLAERQIVVDRQSGKDFDRPGYCRLLRRLKQGDTLVIKSIDRLGRNYGEILEQWRSITREKGAEIVVLDMPLLDTRKSRDLAGTLIADIVLQLLSYVAQTERELIRQRQAEGIAAAKLRGVKLGRPEKARPENFEEVRRQWAQRELSARAAGRLLQVLTGPSSPGPGRRRRNKGRKNKAVRKKLGFFVRFGLAVFGKIWYDKTPTICGYSCEEKSLPLYPLADLFIIAKTRPEWAKKQSPTAGSRGNL